MLIGLYIIFALLTIAIFLTGLLGKDEQGRGIPSLLFLTLIFCGIVGYYSLDLTYVECQNQISWMNTTGNNTALTNNMNCIERTYHYPPLSYFWYGIGILSVIMAIYHTLNRVPIGSKQ